MLDDGGAGARDDEAAMVEMLTVLLVAAGADDVYGGGSMSTVSALIIMPAASAPSSSGFRLWREAVRKDEDRLFGLPVMIWSIAQATSVSVRFWCLTSWLRMYFQVISCVRCVC